MSIDELASFSALILLVGCQEEHQACKNWVMRCWCGYLCGARCRLFAYGPADATAIPKPDHLLPHLNPDWFYLSGIGSPRQVRSRRSGRSGHGLTTFSATNFFFTIHCLLKSSVYFRITLSGHPPPYDSTSALHGWTTFQKPTMTLPGCPGKEAVKWV